MGCQVEFDAGAELDSGVGAAVGALGAITDNVADVLLQYLRLIHVTDRL